MRRISRRDFVTGIIQTISAMTLASTIPSLPVHSEVNISTLDTRKIGHVVRLRFTGKLQGSVGPSRRTIAAGIRVALQKLFDAEDETSPWRAIFPQDKSFSLKTNCLSGFRLSTSPDVSLAVVDCLEQHLHISPTNCTIWDRSERELESAGYHINRTGSGPKIIATDTEGIGYSGSLYMQGNACSLLSRIITDHARCWINIPKLKDHNLSGVSGCLKNTFGVIHNPNKYHGNHCDPYVADVNAIPLIRERFRLAVVDALTVQYHGGPGYKAEWCSKENCLLISRDPVAVDYIGWRMIEQLRKTHGLPPLEMEGRHPIHLQTAASPAYGLGKYGEADICVLEVEL